MVVKSKILMTTIRNQGCENQVNINDFEFSYAFKNLAIFTRPFDEFEADLGLLCTLMFFLLSILVLTQC